MKTLDNKNEAQSKAQVSDVEIFGNTDILQLICKASSKNEGWMKSMKACEIPGVGCIVQVSTQQGGNVAEAVCFVPGVKIVGDKTGRELVAINS